MAIQGADLKQGLGGDVWYRGCEFSILEIKIIPHGSNILHRPNTRRRKRTRRYGCRAFHRAINMSTSCRFPKLLRRKRRKSCLRHITRNDDSCSECCPFYLSCCHPWDESLTACVHYKLPTFAFLLNFVRPCRPSAVSFCGLFRHANTCEILLFVIGYGISIFNGLQQVHQCAMVKDMSELLGNQIHNFRLITSTSPHNTD